MVLYNYLIWNFDPEIFSGFLPVRWYGLFFALGFILGQQVMFYIFKIEAGTDLEKRKLGEQNVESLTLYMIIATIVGARLGHVFFYEPMRYLQDPIRILYIREGGLASHGAGIGIFIGLWIFAKYRIDLKKNGRYGLYIQKTDRGYSVLQIIDRIVILVALCGCLIRFGNFTNSEIIGKPTNSDNGVFFAYDITNALTYDPNGNNWIEDVSFEKNEIVKSDTSIQTPVKIVIKTKTGNYKEADIHSTITGSLNRQLARLSDHLIEPVDHKLNYKVTKENSGYYNIVIDTIAVPRHPAQLYESISCAILFVILLLVWNKNKSATSVGLLSGIFFTWVFTLRFLYEFLKENQVPFEDDMVLNMGQWLSIPAVIAGVSLIIYSQKYKSQGTGS